MGITQSFCVVIWNLSQCALTSVATWKATKSHYRNILGFTLENKRIMVPKPGQPMHLGDVPLSVATCVQGHHSKSQIQHCSTPHNAPPSDKRYNLNSVTSLKDPLSLLRNGREFIPKSGEEVT